MLKDWSEVHLSEMTCYRIHTLVAMQGASICVAILVTILLIIDGAVALYACLIWPRKEEAAAGRALFCFRS